MEITGNPRPLIELIGAGFLSPVYLHTLILPREDFLSQAFLCCLEGEVFVSIFSVVNEKSRARYLRQSDCFTVRTHFDLGHRLQA